MKVTVTLDRKEIFAAIARALLDKGVPLVAGSFYVRVMPQGGGAWSQLTEVGRIEAVVEYECEALSSDQGAVDTGKPA